jgi:hypothetical protein
VTVAGGAVAPKKLRADVVTPKKPDGIALGPIAVSVATA